MNVGVRNLKKEIEIMDASTWKQIMFKKLFLGLSATVYKTPDDRLIVFFKGEREVFKPWFKEISEVDLLTKYDPEL